MNAVYCVRSKSLGHHSRFFIAGDDLSAQSIIRDSLYSGNDFGLFHGAEEDLQLVRVCRINQTDLHVSESDSEDETAVLDLILVPGVREFIEKVKSATPSVRNAADLENLYSGKKKKEKERK